MKYWSINNILNESVGSLTITLLQTLYPYNQNGTKFNGTKFNGTKQDAQRASGPIGHQTKPIQAIFKAANICQRNLFLYVVCCIGGIPEGEKKIFCSSLLYFKIPSQFRVVITTFQYVSVNITLLKDNAGRKILCTLLKISALRIGHNMFCKF